MSISCYFPCPTWKILYKICNLTFHLSPVGGRESNFWNCATQLFPAGKPLNHFSSFFFAPSPPQPAPASLTSRRLPLSFCSHTFGDANVLFCAINWALNDSKGAKGTRRVPESTFIWRRRRSPGPRHRHGLTYGVCASVRARL